MCESLSTSILLFLSPRSTVISRRIGVSTPLKVCYLIRPAQVGIRSFITLTMLCELYDFCSSEFQNLLYYLLISPLIAPKIFLITLFSKTSKVLSFFLCQKMEILFFAIHWLLHTHPIAKKTSRWDQVILCSGLGGCVLEVSCRDRCAGNGFCCWACLPITEDWVHSGARGKLAMV